jgi:hypothetical protein
VKDTDKLLLLGGGLLALYVFTRKTDSPAGSGPSVIEKAASGAGAGVGALIPQATLGFISGATQAFYQNSYSSGFAGGEWLNQTLMGADRSPAAIAQKITLPTNFNTLPTSKRTEIWEDQYQRAVNPFYAVPIVGSVGTLWHQFVTQEPIKLW